MGSKVYIRDGNTVVVEDDDGNGFLSVRQVVCESPVSAQEMKSRIEKNRIYCRNLNASLSYSRRRLVEIDGGSK